MTRLTIALAAACLLGGLGPPASAASAQDVTGAWASDGAACDKLFTKSGTRVAFRKESELFGSGFVIDGNRIRGKAITCEIKSRKTDGDVIHMLASCASDIMLSSVQLSVKLPDANTLIRVFPGMSGMELVYKRCTM